MKERLALLDKAKAILCHPVLATAVLLVLAFPPFKVHLLLFVALVPWLSAIRKESINPVKSGLALGFLFFGSQMFWLVLFVGKWTGSLVMGAIPWLIASLLLMPYFALLGWFFQRAYKLHLPYAIPFIWAAIEMFRSFIPGLAFPHAILATPFAPYPELAQSAAFGTMFLVSAWIVFANCIIVEASEKASIRSTMVALAAFILVLTAGLSRYGEPIIGDKKVISVAQLGTDLAFGDPNAESARIAFAMEEITASAILQQPDLVILPEGLGKTISTNPPETSFRLPDAPTLFGLQRGAGPTYQSAFLVTKNGVKFIDKTRLVIFGEFVPFRNQLSFLNSFNLPSGDLRPGERIEIIESEGMKIGPNICFEALFSDIAIQQSRMGANLLAVMSIDDWFIGTPMIDHLLAGSVYRAIENGLPLVRSSSMGPTCWIDARGNIRSRAPIGKTVLLRGEVTLPKNGPLPYREVFPILSLLVTVFIGVFPAFTGKAQQRRASEDSSEK